MAIISRLTATQDTTNTAVLVEDFLIQTTFGRGVSITIANVGDNGLDWSVWGGNNSDHSDAVEVKATASLADGEAASWSSEYAVFEFYYVYIINSVPDTPTTASLIAIVKN